MSSPLIKEVPSTMQRCALIRIPGHVIALAAVSALIAIAPPVAARASVQAPAFRWLRVETHGRHLGVRPQDHRLIHISADIADLDSLVFAFRGFRAGLERTTLSVTSHVLGNGTGAGGKPTSVATSERTARPMLSAST